MLSLSLLSVMKQPHQSDLQKLVAEYENLKAELEANAKLQEQCDEVMQAAAETFAAAQAKQQQVSAIINRSRRELQVKMENVTEILQSQFGPSYRNQNMASVPRFFQP